MNLEDHSKEINEINTTMSSDIYEIYNSTKAIVNYVDDIGKYLKTVNDAMNDNYQLVEHVSETTDISNKSSLGLVNMVDTIKKVTDELNEVIKE